MSVRKIEKDVKKGPLIVVVEDETCTFSVASPYL